MSNIEYRISNDEGLARHTNGVRDGERESVVDHPISTASALAPPWTQTNPLVVASPAGAMPEHTSPSRLVVQDPEILPIDYRELQPGRPYITAGHDSWRSIAQSELGDAQRWPEIYYLNRSQIGQLTGTLPTGTQIVLPDRTRQ